MWNYGTGTYNYKYMWNYGTLETIIISTWGTMEQVIWVFRRKKEDIMTR